MAFLISALRAIVEMLGLCLLAQGMLYLIAGTGYADNPIYRLFELITRPPRKLVNRVLGGRLGQKGVALMTFMSLFLLWIGLAALRKSV